MSLISWERRIISTKIFMLASFSFSLSTNSSLALGFTISMALPQWEFIWSFVISAGRLLNFFKGTYNVKLYLSSETTFVHMILPSFIVSLTTNIVLSSLSSCVLYQFINFSVDFTHSSTIFLNLSPFLPSYLIRYLHKSIKLRPPWPIFCKLNVTFISLKKSQTWFIWSIKLESMNYWS